MFSILIGIYMEEGQKTKALNVAIPEDIHTATKFLALRDKTTMQEVTTKALISYLIKKKVFNKPQER
jgi:hypothetical protein